MAMNDLYSAGLPLTYYNPYAKWAAYAQLPAEQKAVMTPQQAYEWEPPASTPAENLAILKDYYGKWAKPGEADMSAININQFGRKGSAEMAKATVQQTMAKELSDLLSNEQLSMPDTLAGIKTISGMYQPQIDSMEAAMVAAEDKYWAKVENPGGFWGAADAATQMLASAALSVGGGAMLGGIFGGLGITPDFSNILSKGIIGGATSGSLQGAATGALGGAAGLFGTSPAVDTELLSQAGTDAMNLAYGIPESTVGSGLLGGDSALSSLLGESVGQGFTPIPGLEQTLTSSLPSSGIGAGLGGLGVSGITGAGGSMGWVDDLLSGASNLFGGSGTDTSGMLSDVLGASQSSGWDFGPLSDSLLSGGADSVSGLNLGEMLNSAASGWDFGPLSDALMSGGTDPVSGLTLGQMNPSAIQALLDQAMKDPLGTASKAAKALGLLTSTGSINPSVLSGLLSSGGGYLSGNAATDAAKTAAQAQLEAARIAADAAKFKPVGVTTRFGQSNFTKDAQGNVTGAGYTMPSDIRAMQDSLIGAAPGMLSQFTGSQAATAPMGVGAQRAMSLGNQYLNTDPQAQAQKYYNDQQAIMAAGRARDQAGALTGEFNRGTYGLATGATGMMGAANPRLEAMYNAQRQQDLQAAANATQGGMDYAKFGAGLVGTGGNMLRDMYGTQSASYSPFGTALTGAQNIEGLGQNALDMSINIGKTASPAQSGQLLGQGMLGAAQTMQQANQYSPWGTALMNAGNALNTMQQPQQQQTSGYMFNPFTGVRL